MAAAVFVVTATAVALDLHRFDFFVIHSINGLSRRSSLFDLGVRTLERDMFSNLLMVALVWYVWFKRQHVEARAGVLAGVLAAFFSGVVSRGMQLGLPTHLRPLHDPSLHFQVPFFVDPQSLNHWSSFPSDHAAVLFGLATIIFFTDRGAGWLALGCAAIINLGRIYMGFHYPTDIIAGAMLGVMTVSATFGLSRLPRVMQMVAGAMRHRALFYAVCFYLSFGVVTLFSDFRDGASELLHGLH
jgi:undecaprenyl-diphosphatase